MTDRGRDFSLSVLRERIYKRFNQALEVRGGVKSLRDVDAKRIDGQSVATVRHVGPAQRHATKKALAIVRATCVRT